MSTAIYLRVARNARGQLDTQTQRLHAYAAEHDLAITAIFSDVGGRIDEVVPGFVGFEWGSSVWSGSCETLRQTAKSAGGPLWQDRTRPRPSTTRRSTRTH